MPPGLFTSNPQAQTRSLYFITQRPLPSAACGCEVFIPVNLAAVCDATEHGEKPRAEAAGARFQGVWWFYS